MLRAVGQVPVELRRYVPGFLLNRLQVALIREAIALVESGVAGVDEVDAVVRDGLGLRWALMGPFMNLHLSGGDVGIAHLLDHLGGPIESWWQDLGAPSVTDALQRQVAEGVAQVVVAGPFVLGGPPGVLEGGVVQRGRELQKTLLSQ